MTLIEAPYPGANDATVEQAIRTLAIQIYREQINFKDVEIALRDAKGLVLNSLGDLTPDAK